MRARIGSSHEVERVLFGRGDCVAHGRRVHARVFNRRRVAKFGGSVGGFCFVERVAPLRMVGMLCDWIVDRPFIAAIDRGLALVFARPQHVGIRAWIRVGHRCARAASTPQHAHRVRHDIRVVAGRESGVGVHLEHARNLARRLGAFCGKRFAGTGQANGLVFIKRGHGAANWLGVEPHLFVVGISRRRPAQILSHFTLAISEACSRKNCAEIISHEEILGYSVNVKEVL